MFWPIFSKGLFVIYHSEEPWYPLSIKSSVHPLNINASVYHLHINLSVLALDLNLRVLLGHGSLPVRVYIHWLLSWPVPSDCAMSIVLACPQPDWVLFDDVDSRPPFIGRPLPEDVADVRARNDLQNTAAHPHSEGQLEILSAPNVHPGIVGA